MDTPNPNISSRPIPPSQPGVGSQDMSFNVMPHEGGGKLSAPTPPSGGGSSWQPEEAPSSKKWIYVIIAVIVILALGAAAYYFLGTKKSTEKSSTTQTKLPKQWLSQYFNADVCNDINTCGDDADPDKDGLKNYDEFKESTNPLNPDLDGDGLADGDEVNIYKTEPTLKFTDRRETAAQNNWTDGFQIKSGYDPLTPGLKFTEARNQQIASDTATFKLHEPTITFMARTTAPTTDPTATWKTYTNSQYGFELRFPPTWDGYKTTTRTLTTKGISIGFNFPYTLNGKSTFYSDALQIIVYKVSDWPSVQNPDGSKPPKLLENSTYVYSYAKGTDLGGNAELQAASKDMTVILSTFKLIK